jgi:hypothetical protein
MTKAESELSTPPARAAPPDCKIALVLVACSEHAWRSFGISINAGPLLPSYNFFAAQRPLQPSARLYEPLPLLPVILPVAVKRTPSAPTLEAR